MGQTTKGITYPSDYNAVADLPADLQTMAESIDTAIENSEYDDTAISERVSDLETDNTSNKNRLNTLETDNTSNKSRLTTLETDNTSNKNRLTAIESEQIIQNEEIAALKNLANTELTTSTTEKSTELEANDSANYYSKLDMYGRTEQKQLDGRNWFNGSNPTSASQATSQFNNDIVTISSTATYTIPYCRWELDVNENDVIRANLVILDPNGQLALQVYNGNTWQTLSDKIKRYVNGIAVSSVDYTVPAGITKIRALLYANYDIPTGPASSRYKNVIVTKNNADMTYEEYCGGQASPNTDYPQEIKNVEGNVDIKIKAKNQFNINGEVNVVGDTGTISSGVNIVSENTLRATRNVSSSHGVGQLFNKFNGKEITFSAKLISLGSGTAGLISIYDNNVLKTYKQISNIGGTEKITYTCTSDKVVCAFSTVRGTSAIFTDIQVEENPVRTAYAPYHEQSIDFPLSTGQKMFEGDYLADDGIHHVKYQKELTGTETWQMSTYNNIYAFFINNANIRPIAVNMPHIKKCNKFIYSSLAWKNAPVPSLCENQSSPYLLIFNTDGSMGTTLDAWKQYVKNLYDNNDPIIVEYELATETVEAYTPAQQQAYNKLKNLVLDYGKNYIWTVTEGLNPNLQLTYKQSNRIEIENIKNAIISMGGNV